MDRDKKRERERRGGWGGGGGGGTLEGRQTERHRERFAFILIDWIFIQRTTAFAVL